MFWLNTWENPLPLLAATFQKLCQDRQNQQQKVMYRGLLVVDQSVSQPVSQPVSQSASLTFQYLLKVMYQGPS